MFVTASFRDSADIPFMLFRGKRLGDRKNKPSGRIRLNGRGNETVQERAVLRYVENERRITEEQDAEFLYALQKALLLALKEAGRLNEAQYSCAAEKLYAQRSGRD